MVNKWEAVVDRDDDVDGVGGAEEVSPAAAVDNLPSHSLDIFIHSLFPPPRLLSTMFRQLSHYINYLPR